MFKINAIAAAKALLATFFAFCTIIGVILIIGAIYTLLKEYVSTTLVLGVSGVAIGFFVMFYDWFKKRG